MVSVTLVNSRQEKRESRLLSKKTIGGRGAYEGVSKAV